MPVKRNTSVLIRFGKSLISIGPAFFLVGYSIGTGSVVAMSSAGSRFGFSSLWALALSCLFSYVLLDAYGRYTVVTGEGALYAIKKHLGRIGHPLALVMLVGLIFVEILALIGIMGIISDLIHEWSIVLFGGTGWSTLRIAIVIIILTYTIIFLGEYSLLEKVLIVFVSLMGIGFLITMFVNLPSPDLIFKGLIPSIPQDKDAPMIIAAVVGTTLTAPTFVVRSILMKEKQWTVSRLGHQRKDALWAALMMFVISGAIMACAAGTLYVMNKPVEEVITMVLLLEPLLGVFALSVFIAGILAAGLSSIFPIVMLAPLLIGDYINKPVNYKSKQFRILTGVAILFGLIVPLLGARPIFVMLISQLFQVFVLPMVVLAIMYLINKKELMKEHKANVWLNVGLWSTFVFSLIISYQSVVGLIASFETIF